MDGVGEDVVDPFPILFIPGADGVSGLDGDKVFLHTNDPIRFEHSSFAEILVSLRLDDLQNLQRQN